MKKRLLIRFYYLSFFIYTSSTSFLKQHETLSKHRRACRHVHVLKPSTPFTKPSFMCSRAYAFPASRVLFSLVVFAEQPNTREKKPRKVGKHAHFLLAHRLITRRIWGTTELSKRVNSSRGHAYQGPTVYLLLSDGIWNSVVLSMDSFF